MQTRKNASIGSAGKPGLCCEDLGNRQSELRHDLAAGQLVRSSPREHAVLGVVHGNGAGGRIDDPDRAAPGGGRQGMTTLANLAIPKI